MRTTLRVLLATLGAAAVAIGLGVLLAGPAVIAGISESAFAAVTGTTTPPTGRWPATMDSELRFYAPFWGVFGLALIAAARDLERRLNWVPPLAALFFAGGVGRAISYVTVGPPHPVFTLLMAIELTLPFIFLALWRALRLKAP